MMMIVVVVVVATALSRAIMITAASLREICSNFAPRQMSIHISLVPFCAHHLACCSADFLLHAKTFFTLSLDRPQQQIHFQIGSSWPAGQLDRSERHLLLLLACSNCKTVGRVGRRDLIYVQW